VRAVLDLPRLARGIPPPPAPELTPALDAAARCFARHGVARTSMNDIARELRVSRSGIYRQLGSIDQALRLLTAREVNRQVSEALPGALARASGPEVVLVMLEEVVGFAQHHPVVRKVIADEPELIGPYLLTDLPAITAQVADLVAPLLEQAMDAGLVRRQDARVLAGWLVRVVIVLLLDPVDQPLRSMFEQLLLPALTPH
jgi:AcrR family transcriptional regulator